MGNFSSIFSDELLSLHEEGIDDMMASDVGETCIIKYPPIWVDCPECEVDAIGNKPSSINIFGKRVPVSHGKKCVQCGDNGKIQQEVSEDMRALVYWSYNKKRWAKFASTNIQVPEGVVEILIQKTDLAKVLKANFIEVGSRLQPGKIFRYKLAGAPEPTGFRLKYAYCILDKAA